MARATLSHPKPAEAPYSPPQKMLGPCAHCGGMVLRGPSLPDGTPTRLTPALGYTHTCQREKKNATPTQRSTP